MTETSVGRGRPRKGSGYAKSIRVRLTDDMDSRLENLSKLTGVSKSDLLRDSFDGFEKLKLFQLTSSVEDEYYDENDAYDDEI